MSDRETMPETPSEKSSPVDRPAARILIAEDEPLIRLDLRESLIEEGYEVVAEAGDGEEAIEAIRLHRPDVALLDIKMPKLDGLEVAREVAKERLTAVVMLTAFSQRDLIDQAREAGALNYLVKPFKQADLVPAIELAIARFKELVALAEQSESLTEQLASRKLVDRAKGRLMDTKSMSEQEAFRYLQTTAMRQRTSMRSIAEAILEGTLEIT